jgi:hypothetical protein
MNLTFKTPYNRASGVLPFLPYFIHAQISLQQWQESHVLSITLAKAANAVYCHFLFICRGCSFRRPPCCCRQAPLVHHKGFHLFSDISKSKYRYQDPLIYDRFVQLETVNPPQKAKELELIDALSKLSLQIWDDKAYSAFSVGTAAWHTVVFPGFCCCPRLLKKNAPKKRRWNLISWVAKFWI